MVAPPDSSMAETVRRRVFPILRRYFRLELVGAVGRIPAWDREPCMFVMNHTAILGLEVYLLGAALDRLRPEAALPRTTVWKRFLEMPVIGPFYRAAGCIPMTVDGAADALRAGSSVLVLPQGPDATDIRDPLGRFHTGFLRVVRALHGELEVPVVPFGWAGVDEANPWWLTTNPTLVRMLMKPFMPHFDFALVPRVPMLRPSKVVFAAGEPLRFTRDQLTDESALHREAARVREIVGGLVADAAALRRRRIDDSLAERVLHRATNTRDIAWNRRRRA
jgi:1-acyl-sn-glycerol-3-phosphate acyltransferase